MDVCIIDVDEPSDCLATAHEAFVTFNRVLWVTCGALAVLTYADLMCNLVSTAGGA